MRKGLIFMLASALLTSGCSQLVPERPRALISDEQAGSMDIYATGESDIHSALETMAGELRLLLLQEDGTFASADLDYLNVHFHDILVIPGDRQILTLIMPGDGAASVNMLPETIDVAMTGDAMTCWGIRILPDEELRTGVFSPGCSADDLKDGVWAPEWPEAPEPESSADGIEFGTRPRG